MKSSPPTELAEPSDVVNVMNAASGAAWFNRISACRKVVPPVPSTIVGGALSVATSGPVVIQDRHGRRCAAKLTPALIGVGEIENVSSGSAIPSAVIGMLMTAGPAAPARKVTLTDCALKSSAPIELADPSDVANVMESVVGAGRLNAISACRKVAPPVPSEIVGGAPQCRDERVVVIHDRHRLRCSATMTSALTAVRVIENVSSGSSMPSVAIGM